MKFRKIKKCKIRDKPKGKETVDNDKNDNDKEDAPDNKEEMNLH